MSGSSYIKIQKTGAEEVGNVQVRSPASDLERSPDPHLVNVPTMMGFQGPQAVRRFYAKRLIGQFSRPMSFLNRFREPMARIDSWMN